MGRTDGNHENSVRISHPPEHSFVEAFVGLDGRVIFFDRKFRKAGVGFGSFAPRRIVLQPRQHAHVSLRHEHAIQHLSKIDI